MKTKDLIIAALTVGIVVFAVLYYNVRKEVSSSQARMMNEPGNKKEKCYTARQLLDTLHNACGVGFSERDIPGINKSIAARKSILNTVYGYQINLKCIDSLYAAIQRYNKIAPDSLKIRGLRFYEAKSTRMIQDKDQYEQDLVMIPYLASGKDIFLVDYKRFRVKDMMIYSHFRPCPKLCADEEKFYIYQK